MVVEEVEGLEVVPLVEVLLVQQVLEEELVVLVEGELECHMAYFLNN